MRSGVRVNAGLRGWYEKAIEEKGQRACLQPVPASSKLLPEMISEDKLGEKWKLPGHQALFKSLLQGASYFTLCLLSPADERCLRASEDLIVVEKHQGVGVEKYLAGYGMDYSTHTTSSTPVDTQLSDQPHSQGRKQAL